VTSYRIPQLDIAGAGRAPFVLTTAVIMPPLPVIGLNLAVGLAGLILGMGMFALGWIGGGDAKLFRSQRPLARGGRRSPSSC